MRTIGELHYSPANALLPRAAWLIKGEPHMMMRVKRMFSRVRSQRTGIVMLTDTIEVARDLEWFCERYPLDMDDVTRQRLKDKANEHRRQQETIERVLAGQRLDLELPAPARPARDYQQIAADLAIATGRLLITDEVGLGKSMTGILLFGAPDALPALVVTLTHLPPQWVEEIAETYPWLTTHIAKRGSPYDLADRSGRDPDVVVMNYSKLAGWADHLAGPIRTILFDEMQELRRAESLKYTAACQIADAAHYAVGLTASPVYNYGGEIFNIVSVLDADALGTREEFIREWGAGDRGGNVVVESPHALGTYLREQGLMLGRTRKEVGRELPDAIRIPQKVFADEDVFDRLRGDAMEMARLILAASTEGKERFKASGELDWRMRQATGIAKAPYVAEFVRMLLESEEQIVLFGWHRAVYDIWAERLESFDPVFYTGEESPTQKLASEHAFKAGESRLLIMSLRAGAGLDGLQEHAHVAVFGELDWSPQVHNQCIGRLRRDGMNDPVVAYFLVSDHGADPVMAEVLNIKRMQAEPMLDPDGELFAEKVGDFDRVKRLAEEVLRRGEVAS